MGYILRPVSRFFSGNLDSWTVSIKHGGAAATRSRVRWRFAKSLRFAATVNRLFRTSTCLALSSVEFKKLFVLVSRGDCRSLEDLRIKDVPGLRSEFSQESETRKRVTDKKWCLEDLEDPRREIVWYLPDDQGVGIIYKK